MGAALATRLLEAGHDVAVYNRTRAKAEALAGAVVVDSPADLADRDIVFTMVAGSDDFKEVAIGPNGVLSRPDAVPRVLVDSTTISQAASDDVRAVAAERGTGVLAAPGVRQREGRRRRAADDGGVRARSPRIARRASCSSCWRRRSPTSATATARGWSRSVTT